MSLLPHRIHHVLGHFGGIGLCSLNGLECDMHYNCLVYCVSSGGFICDPLLAKG